MSTTATQQPTTHARRDDALAPPAAGTTPVQVVDSPGGGVVDAATNEGLRLALSVIGQHGWECAAGRAVIAALQARCKGWASTRAAASHTCAGAVDAGEVLSVGWLTLARFGARVAAAEAPWAYLWTAVQNAMAVEIGAAEVLSRKAVERPASQWPRTALRSGLFLFGELDAEDDDDEPGPRRGMTVRRALAALAAAGAGGEGPGGPSRPVAALVELLARGRECERQFWSDVVQHALEVMDGARRSYEEVVLRRDPYLAGVLGLSPKELSALAALLIGPRRGDRAGQCLLLALHRDPTTDPAEVTGAVARIGVLTACRAVAAAGPAWLPEAA